jgi:D-3-phosphoglycerate dehydrogenase
MKSYQVIRTHSSPYQATNFVNLEQEMVESIPKLSYGNLKNFDPHLKTILMTNTHTKLRELPATLLESTALIIHPNSGYDHFIEDYELCKEIPLVIGHKIRAQAVAEYSLACLFEGISQLPQHLSWDKDRKWERKLISEQKVWIFGYGHIGRIISASLTALGADVSIVDPYIHDCPHTLLHHWKDGDLKEANVVIACSGLNQTSKHMFNEDFFSNANPDLLFINGARGKLVDELALKHFLASHAKAFAFLDVFENEPFSTEWMNMPQVWKTSHIAGVSNCLDKRMLDFEQEVLHDFLEINTNFFMMKYFKELLQNKWIEGVLI